MRDSGSTAESAQAETSAWADFAMLAARVAGARGARLERLGAAQAFWGAEDGVEWSVPVTVEGHAVGRLVLFGAEGDVGGLAPLLRRLESHVRDEETLALAEHANDVALSANRRFEALFRGVASPCYTVDAEGRLMEWNDAAEACWGPDLALVWGCEAGRVVWPERPEAERDLVRRALAGETAREGEFAAFPLRDAKGAVVGAMVTVAG